MKDFHNLLIQSQFEKFEKILFYIFVKHSFGIFKNAD